MGRGAFSILIALAAVAMLSGPAEAGPDRLVGACQAAITVHAHKVTLEFDEAVRDGSEVRLGFAFANAGRNHGGTARCRFHRAPSRTAPPSLVELEITGGITASRFLQSHQAVWRYFMGAAEPVADTTREESVPPPGPLRPRPPRPPRPMFGAAQ